MIYYTMCLFYPTIQSEPVPIPIPSCYYLLYKDLVVKSRWAYSTQWVWLISSNITPVTQLAVQWDHPRYMWSLTTHKYCKVHSICCFPCEQNLATGVQIVLRWGCLSHTSSRTFLVASTKWIHSSHWQLVITQRTCNFSALQCYIYGYRIQ